MYDEDRCDCCAKDSGVFRFVHQIITLRSYSGRMGRSSAWQALRGRKRSTRPANTWAANMHRGPRETTTLSSGPTRPARLNDVQLEEWKALEFRHLKPPSGEDWNR
jgi:hypothetical protein